MRVRCLGVLLGMAFLPAGAAAQQMELPAEVQEWMTDGWERRFMVMVSLGDSLFNNGSCQLVTAKMGPVVATAPTSPTRSGFSPTEISTASSKRFFGVFDEETLPTPIAVSK